MSMKTIAFKIPDVLVCEMMGSIRAVDALSAPSSGSYRLIETKTIAAGSSKLIKIVLGYVRPGENVLFTYSYQAVLENNEVKQQSGEFNGETRDFRCGDIGLFSTAEIDEDSETSKFNTLLATNNLLATLN